MIDVMMINNVKMINDVKRNNARRNTKVALIKIYATMTTTMDEMMTTTTTATTITTMKASITITMAEVKSEEKKEMTWNRAVTNQKPPQSVTNLRNRRLTKDGLQTTIKLI